MRARRRPPSPMGAQSVIPLQSTTVPSPQFSMPWRACAAGALAAAVVFACSSDRTDLQGPDPLPGGPRGVLSLAASTFALSADSVAVGGSVVISVVPRDGTGVPLGPGQPVTLDLTGGSSNGRLGSVAFFTWDSSYRVRYTGDAAGSPLTVRARIAGAPLPRVATLRVQAPPPPVWTFCSNTGEVCTFTGTRDVRLVAPGGVTHVQEFTGTVPCAPSGYARGFTKAPGAAYTRCEHGELKVEELTNAMPGMSGMDAPVLHVPRGDRGVATRFVRSSGDVPSAPMGEGSFRMTCTLAKMDFFDPIVYPGQPKASHLHMFFGNVAITPSSTSSSLASSGTGTCSGGTVNRTGYWVPALFDVRTSDIIPPDFATIYYKTGYNVDPATITDIPEGLVMIAGDKANVGRVQEKNKLDVALWACGTAASTNTGAVPSCPVGDIVTLLINFPQCLDGVRLDSPDHQSHMAYPVYRNPPERSTCPSSHPVMVPIITEIFTWPVTTGMSSQFWRLTSDMYSVGTRGGYSAHADWMNGWEPTFLRSIVTNCLKPGRDCFVNLLGDGRELY